MKGNRIALWVGICAVVGTVTAVFLLRFAHWRPRMVTIQGAVIRRDSDPRKELPIAGGVITAYDDSSSVSTVSGDTGYFNLKFPEKIWPKEVVHLAFRAADYMPLNETLLIGVHTNTKQLYVVRMTSTSPPPPAPVAHPTTVQNIRIRYTVNVRSDANVGSEVQVFEVRNQGNVPCKQNDVCSPDGLFKAARKSVSLDAGPGNVFENVRASCIAGPCAFTRIDTSGFNKGGQKIVITATDWSDTATFLVEAEVFQQSIVSRLRWSFPVKYGRDMHFTAPPTAEGVSIEADIGGSPTVFPLGPDLYMSWVICNSRKGPNQDTIYQCELKPGYQF
jgi:hypothetical protein